jgi:hypothetical protein
MVWTTSADTRCKELQEHQHQLLTTYTLERWSKTQIDLPDTSYSCLVSCSSDDDDNSLKVSDGTQINPSVGKV